MDFDGHGTGFAHGSRRWVSFYFSIDDAFHSRSKRWLFRGLRRFMMEGSDGSSIHFHGWDVMG